MDRLMKKLIQWDQNIQWLSNSEAQEIVLEIEYLKKEKEWLLEQYIEDETLLYDYGYPIEYQKPSAREHIMVAMQQALKEK